jgi:predicted nucleotidyltransferase
MEVQKDFKELLELFNAHKVRYLIIGSYALAFHGAPRYTGDIDILVEPEAENATKILNALNEFGFGTVGLKKSDLATPNQVIQLGCPPVRIDLITSISGVSWKEAFDNRIAGQYGDAEVSYIGREQYVINKKASGRKKDIADLEALGEE